MNKKKFISTVVGLSVLALIIFVIVNNKHKRPPKFIPRSDTLETLAAYILPDKQVRFDAVYQIVREVAVVDSNLKPLIIKDTLWYIKPPGDSMFVLAARGAVRWDRDLKNAMSGIRDFSIKNPQYFKPPTITPTPKK